MSTSRIGNYSPKPSDGLNPNGIAQSKGDDGKVQDAKQVDAAATLASGNQAAAKNKNAKDYGVNISDAAKNRAEAYQKALKIAHDTPDIREDRVSELKKQIADGNYKPDAGKIADGILREAIKDHLAESES